MYTCTKISLNIYRIKEINSDIILKLFLPISQSKYIMENIMKNSTNVMDNDPKCESGLSYRTKLKFQFRLNSLCLSHGL
jgi:hypothetical protein